MKPLLSLLLAAVALGQAPGTVDVSANITATAGTLTCVGTAFVAATVSTMRFKCSEGSAVLFDHEFTVTAPGSTVYSIGRGPNIISLLLTKGNPIADQWQIGANGTMKSGTF